MLNRTHIAIGLFFMLFFVSKVVHVWTYIFVFAVATLLPNLDRFFSFRFFMKIGKENSRKRGLLHSFTFCLIITLLLAWFFPTVAFPFFLAYGTHLIADSWTVEGIYPFWPLRHVAKGSVRNGGSLEKIIFFSFIFADVVLAWILVA
ncbi:MAG: metal-dependent hydrolase [Nanoarchaeota archaeon]